MRRWPVAFAVLGLLGLASVTGAPPAAACSCVGYDDTQAFAAADAVFVGTVIDEVAAASKGGSGAPVLRHFKVDEVHKGPVHEDQGVVSPDTCDLSTEAAGRYLVFARTTPDMVRPVPAGATLFTNSCNGTRLTSGADLPASLGPAAAPLPGEDGLAEITPTGPAAVEVTQYRPWWLAAAATAAILVAGGLAWLGARRPGRREGPATP
jgi:hypothetical protein